MTSNSFQKKIHPMVTVPDAIRTVLRQTALILLQREKPIPSETVSTSPPHSLLLGKITVEDVIMKDPGYPNYNASIMDGYAINSSDTFTPGEDWTHCVCGKVFAGDNKNKSPQRDSGIPSNLVEAYYVTTGAVVPNGFDCVVPMEQCHISSDEQKIAIQPTATIVKGTWIRKVGCDMPAGSMVLPRGHVLQPVSLGLLLQAGCKSVKVKKPVIVGVMSTGNELSDTYGDIEEHGKIPDVNRPILLALLSTFGPCCTHIDLGIQRDDDLDSLTSALKSAAEVCDVIITTGGVSMGESDVIEEVLVDKMKGSLHFGRMHMKPGKPTTFVSLPSGTLVFAMPGNPVSCTVCTHLLVKPCLDLLRNGIDDTIQNNGESVDEIVCQIVQNCCVHQEVNCKLSCNIKLDKERPEYHRVVLFQSDDGSGDLIAKSTGVQRSSRLMSLRDAEALLMLPRGAEKSEALAGEECTALLLEGKEKDCIKVCESTHLNKEANSSLKISLLHVVGPPSYPDDDAKLEMLSQRVKTALSGNDGRIVDIISSKRFRGDALDLFAEVTAEKDSVDILVVVCEAFAGSLRYHLDIAATLRKQLVKVAESIAMIARRGAASVDPKTALFETVVGFMPTGRGCMMVLIPEQGLQGSLSNVRELLKHG
eukprot:CAMPEP_0194212392 /NCGR_PEP_ID=MMETSP0156-20130528/12206_1 /TAXON_ID=33649 /ORGANISM="Thalassionema nitzschioides, Strain L26-B" /LENGTH=647 /DNA_ID=CAMNT_0038940201 /DNA_START=43 /DNA_END=1982 /DNA_ORIENTATION=-